MNGLDAVKAATWDLHTRAERSGIIADILAGRANDAGVALLLRNLLPVYEALDTSPAGHPALARTGAIRAGLETLAPDHDPSLLPAGSAYAKAVRIADPPSLLAHAYVRYLGDINGGLLMQRRLVACIGPQAEALTLHLYPDIADLPAFKRDYRQALDDAVRSMDLDLVIAGARRAFAMNIELSEAVQAEAAHP
ncbi:MAG TPA: biliverdin-producing heme oxygenase [Rhodopila sp.]|nr:biliverdin-producing heme oxygenase [Rhodopila sp.]